MLHLHLRFECFIAMSNGVRAHIAAEALGFHVGFGGQEQVKVRMS